MPKKFTNQWLMNIRGRNQQVNFIKILHKHQNNYNYRNAWSVEEKWLCKNNNNKHVMRETWGCNNDTNFIWLFNTAWCNGRRMRAPILESTVQLADVIAVAGRSGKERKTFKLSLFTKIIGIKTSKENF